MQSMTGAGARRTAATDRRRRRAVALLAVAGLVGACRADGPSTATGPGARPPAGATSIEGRDADGRTTAPPSSTTVVVSPEGLAATLERYREDDSTGQMQIQVTNTTERSVELTAVRFAWSAMAEQPPTTKVHHLWPGQTLDVPVPVGAVRCSRPLRFDVVVPPDPAHAIALATFDGAAPAEVELPVTDVRSVLERLYRPACQGEKLAETATIAFGPQWTDTTLDGKPAAQGVLHLRRTNGIEPVVIRELLGTVLLDAAPVPAASGPLLRLPAGSPEASTGIVLTQSGDCRAHALAESKHTFFLRAVVEVEPDVELVLYVQPELDDQPQLLQMINRACGVG
jgi:hypothetical protein